MNAKDIIIPVISLILIVIALLTNNWSKSKSNSIVFNKGLWNTCLTYKINLDSEKSCEKNKNTTSLTITKILVISSIILIGFYLFTKYFNQKLNSINILLLAGIFSILSCIIWAVKENKDEDSNYKLDYSWIINVVASILLFLHFGLVKMNKL